MAGEEGESGIFNFPKKIPEKTEEKYERNKRKIPKKKNTDFKASTLFEAPGSFFCSHTLP